MIVSDESFIALVSCHFCIPGLGFKVVGDWEERRVLVIRERMTAMVRIPMSFVFETAHAGLEA